MPARIALWGPPLAPLTGGNLYDRILAGELRARGYEVSVGEFGGAPEPLRDSGPAPAVVLQDALLHREFVARNLAWKPPRPRIVALVHHLMSDEPERGEAERRRLRAAERRFLDSVDGVLAPSRASAAAALRVSERPLPAAVVPPGRDRFAGGAFPALPGPEEIRARAAGPLRAVFVGNLIRRKRLLELLEAVARAPGWTLQVAGRESADPGYAARARGRAAASDLVGRVAFHGGLGPGRLAALLRESCLLAVPSTHEGFGIAYLEGFAFGLPALAAASGGAPEIVGDGETGWLIPREPATAAQRLAGHLRELAADRSKLAAMGIRAAARRRAHPTWAESVSAADGLWTGAAG